MARIKTVGPRIPTFDTRIAPPSHAPRQHKISDSFYSSAAWIAVRDRVRREAGGRCQMPGCTSRGRWVDHRIERRDGGADFDMANLWLLCSTHHQLKTARARDARRATH